MGAVCIGSPGCQGGKQPERGSPATAPCQAAKEEPNLQHRIARTFVLAPVASKYKPVIRAAFRLQVLPGHAAGGPGAGGRPRRKLALVANR